MEKRKDTLVVIPTYGEFVYDLTNAINSLIKQVVDENIVIVDVEPNLNIKALKHKYKHLKFVSRSKNSGPAGGRNDGLKVLNKNHKYILFFDHDMIAADSMIENLINRATSNDDIGIVTPKIVYKEDTNVVWSAGTDINLLTGKVIFYGGDDNGQFNSAKQVSIAPATMLVKTELIRKLNGFNEAYVTTYEDSEFCFRAKLNNWQTWYEPKAKAVHNLSMDKSQSYKRLLNRSYYVARNRIWFMRQFGKPKNLYILFLPVFFLYYLKIAIKNFNINAIFQYLKGTYDGFKTSW